MRSNARAGSRMRHRLAMALVLTTGSAVAQGVPIQVLAPTFACRDVSDMIRLGLRMAEDDKAGFIAFYDAHQAAGDCVPLRAGTIARLEQAHDEQGLHLDCIRQQEDPVCFWSANPRLAPAA